MDVALIVLGCLVLVVIAFFSGYFYHASQTPKLLAGMSEQDRKTLAAKVAEEKMKR